MDITKALRKSDLFHFMEDRDLQIIIEKSGGVKRYEAGECLFIEDTPANCFFVLIEGKIRISRLSKEGKETILKNMLPGDSFAEIILFEQSKYPATATSLENSTVLRIDKKTFKKLLDNPQNSNAFIVNLIKKMRFLARKVELLNNAKVSDRFYHFIETDYGQNEVIEIKESKKEIAEVIGTVPETFSRMISSLKKNKTIISWNRKRLILKKGFWKNQKP